VNPLQFYRQLPSGAKILGGFLILILIGTGLLLLPQSIPSGKTLTFTDAFFTATSAVCVTGLIVVQTPFHFTAFGQLIILVLFQLGGLGIAFASSLVFLSLRGSVGMDQQFAFQNTFMNWPFRTVKKAFFRVLALFFGLEILGAGILTTQFLEDHPPARALWHGIFHSVSAICNAGFSLNPDSIVGYQNNPIVLITVSVLIVFGGIGFVVIAEILNWGESRNHFTLHTRTMLLGTVVLLTFGTGVFLVLQPESGPLNAFFQSVTARTAGFNSVDVAAWSTPAALTLMFLMFVGAGPASTAGGIKISTFLATVSDVVSRMKQRETVHWLDRRLPRKLVNNSVVLFALALSVVGVFTFLLTLTEPAPLEVLLFEVFSALGTVGLSLGITPELSTAGKWIIIAAMFLGRLGPLTFVLLIIDEQQVNYTYPEEDLLIG
jgi:trk system potassium uptake protein TrkH